MSTPHVVVLHPCTTRPHAERFQRELDALNDSIIRSIQLMGWTTELIPTSERLLTRVLERVAHADLVVVMGGEDVAPQYYGGAPEYIDQGDHEPTADKAEIAAIQLSARLRKPLLGICRGHQLINVAFGGTLIQHLPSSAIHRGEDQGLGPFVRHPVRLTADGAKTYSESGAVLDGEVVYSTHHQAIDTLGEGLVITAKAPDGVIEAIAHGTLPIFGVQWHPEHPDAVTSPISRLCEGVISRTDSLVVI